MRTKLAITVTMLAANLIGAQDKLADQLRKAIVEEESYQNLDKAIQAYQGILMQFEAERGSAATALFHLAECYRKQGKKDLANASYQRVIREFPDQTKLAEASRNYLPKNLQTGQEARDVDATKATLEPRLRYRYLLGQEIKLVETQIESAQRRVEIGVGSSAELTALKKELLELQRTLAAFDAGAMPIPTGIIK